MSVSAASSRITQSAQPIEGNDQCALDVNCSSSMGRPVRDKQFFIDIGKRIFTELAVSQVLALSCTPFVAKDAVFKMFKHCLAGSAFSGLLQVMYRNPFGQAEPLSGRNASLSDRIGRETVMRDIIKGWCGGVFYGHSARRFSGLIHELGHALAAWQCFQGIPSITIQLEGGGITTFNAEKPTSFGEVIGVENSIGLTTFSGPGLALLAASAALVFSHSCQNSHSQVSAYLSGVGRLIYIDHILYALGALRAVDSDDLSHDFATLKMLGIHPLVAAFCMFLSLSLLPQKPLDTSYLVMGLFLFFALSSFL
ncbi:MAG: hypothetical protein Q8L98_03135 [Chlamydiales bacterium]|nr:hypothetical protein [Chlamydiales bacterium]